MNIAQELFLQLSLQSKLHHKLDGLERRYRDMLHSVDEKEILAYNDEAKIQELERLKTELLMINFRKGKK